MRYGLSDGSRGLLPRLQDLVGRMPRAALPIGDAVSPVLLLMPDGAARGQVKLQALKHVAG